LTIRNDLVKKEGCVLPKIYSDDERAYIIKRLKEEAGYCLSAFGIKGTTVDMLIDRVKIPKGTFYLFYESKELLLFEVILEQHEIMEKQLLKKITSLKNRVSVHNLTGVLYKFYKSIDDIALFRFIGTGEIELLYRKLPKEIIDNHLAHDTDIIHEIVEILSLSPDIKTEYYSAAFRNIFFAVLRKRETGEEHFDESLVLMIRGLVLQLLG
jgi:AcrR family transcriptional regulator